MKTNQIMESVDRELCGFIIKQRTKDEYFNLNNIIFATEEIIRKETQKMFRINFHDFLKQENIQKFLIALESETGMKPYIKGAKNRDAWIHPYFAIKILTHFNPRFEVKVYKWLWDYLIKNRNNSGDSYNIMCGSLYRYSSNKSEFPLNIKRVSSKIKELVGCNDWNTATEEQLRKRDELQKYIADLTNTLKDSKQGLKLGIDVYLEKYKD